MIKEDMIADAIGVAAGLAIAATLYFLKLLQDFIAGGGL